MINMSRLFEKNLKYKKEIGRKKFSTKKII